ncbi:hypothetical protein Q5H93_21790 [Hymenobacter sp. ASUV-10]|uniref:DUF2793 domain-containing protein n=1 Tax=Hymenobacter aranciens TaxID=3063996 RepID=A0ABT9BI60_9BACT|nr:hypothetical protein [Hymenobacter sp. ASUV-10]MDO7877389.1 hypothetical protein [Hymenobacter sp. ASUV-10]
MPLTPYSQQLSDLLPLKIRSAGDPAGPTTAEDHRAFEALEIEAIAYLESMTRGNRIFVAELNGSRPGPDIEAIEGDLCLDRIGSGLPLWTWLDGEWIALGNLVGADGSKILGGVGEPAPALGIIGDWYFRYNVAAFEKMAGGWVSRFPIGTGATVPDQVGQNGKYLSTNGTNTFWATVPAGYSDNQAKDAALQAILATSTITATYNTGTRLLSVNVRAASLNMSHLDPAALATGTLTGAQQTALSNAANWTAKAYNSSTLVLTGIPAGTTYDDANYLYYFASDNRPLRMALA